MLALHIRPGALGLVSSALSSACLVRLRRSIQTHGMSFSFNSVIVDPDIYTGFMQRREAASDC
jgi:hypothetical protein